MTTALKIEWADIDGQLLDEPATLYWEATDDDGQWVSFLSIPIEGYAITKTWEKLSALPRLTYRDLGGNWINLSRPDAGQLAIALTAALLRNSESLIDHFIQAGVR